MANGHGGDRVPERPAAASGPGALSQRTDGQAARYVKNLEYGEGKKLLDTQNAAPMAEAPDASAAAAAAGKAAKRAASEPPLMAEPTMRPDEPVTAGSPLGPGPGPPEPPRIDLPPDVLAEAAMRAYIVEPSTENLIMVLSVAEAIKR